MKRDWKYWALLGAVVLAGGFSSCSDDEEDEKPETPAKVDVKTIHLNGYITKDSVLKDLGLDVDYIIDDQLTVQDNAKLTIEPGVTINFAEKRGYLLCEDNAALNMEGTAEKPIVLQGSYPVRGSWANVIFQTNRPENKMTYVKLLNGGSDAEYGVLAITNEGSVSVKNCKIDGSLGAGVYNVFADKALTAFENDTITNASKSAMLLQSYGFLENIAANNVFYGNGANGIEFAGYANVIEKTVTFNNLGYDYIINSDMTIQDEGLMIVNDSVTFKFGNGVGVWIPSGLIQVNGTAEKPVVFTGTKDEAGFWRGITFESNTQNQGGSYIKNCEFKNAADKEGEDNSAFYVHTMYTEGVKYISFENVKFTNILNYALSVLWDYDRKEVQGIDASNVTFENCGHNVFVDLDGALNMSFAEGYGAFFDSLEEVEIAE